MIFFVVIVNLFITSINIYLTVKILQLRQILVKKTKILIRCEQRIHSVLSSAPQCILQRQKNIDHLYHRYQKLQFNLQKTRKLIALVSLIYRFSPYRRSPR